IGTDPVLLAWGGAGRADDQTHLCWNHSVRVDSADRPGVAVVRSGARHRTAARAVRPLVLVFAHGLFGKTGHAPVSHRFSSPMLHLPPRSPSAIAFATGPAAPSPKPSQPRTR